MNDIPTVGKEFVDWFGDLMGLESGSNLFYMYQPETDETPSWWIEQNSGMISKELATKQYVKRFNFLIYYRNTKAKEVDKQIDKAQQLLSHTKCFNLPDYTVYRLEVSNLGTQNSHDGEGRYRGTLQVALSIYDDYSR